MLDALRRLTGIQAAPASVDPNIPASALAAEASRVDAAASAALQGGDVKVASFGSMAPRSPTSKEFSDLMGVKGLFEEEGSPTAAPAATRVEAGAPADVLGASLAVNIGSLNTSLADNVEGSTSAAPIAKEAADVKAAALPTARAADSTEETTPVASLEEAAAHVGSVASTSITPTPPASSRLYNAAVLPLQVVAWPVRTLASGLWSGASYMVGRKPA